MVSESEARQWLSEVKSFRREWAEFAVHSREHFDPFRDRGESLPESFFQTYKRLQERKSTISERITDRTQQVGFEDWSAPLPADSLHEFELRLTDLIDICRELDRIAAEQRLRFQQTLSGILALRSTDLALDQLLIAVRQDANAEMQLLVTRPLRIADLDLEKKILGLEALLALVADARTRYGLNDSHGVRLDSAQVLHAFLTVQDSFGPALAVEALRSGFAATTVYTTIADTGENLQEADGALTATEHTDTQFTTLSESSHSWAAPATSQQISQLLKRHSQTVLPPQLPAKRPAYGYLAQWPADRVSICDLLTAADKLKDDAEKLANGTGTAERLQGTVDARHVRARVFRNLSTLLVLAAEVFGEGEPATYLSGNKLSDLLSLIAESQSAVRIEALHAGLAANPEQETAFRWLRHTCSPEEQGIMIQRFMRLDDPADPAGHADLQRRILHFCRPIQQSIQNHKNLNELRRCRDNILSDSQKAPDEPHLELWLQIDSLTSSLVRNGIRHNDARLREILSPVIDFLPEHSTEEIENEAASGIEFSSELQIVAESIADYLKQQNYDVPEDSQTELPVSENLQRARQLLGNKVMVIIGGVCKPHAKQRLLKGLQLKEVRWLTARKQDKVSAFRPQLTGASLVVLITKIIGHKHNDVREMCDELNIPYAQTRQGSGYSVNQLVSTILDQASERLANQIPEQPI